MADSGFHHPGITSDLFTAGRLLLFCRRVFSGRFFHRRSPGPSRRGRGLLPEALIPICRGPPQIEDIVFHECGQLLDPTAEHVLEALGDVLLPRTVHANAFHAISMAVAASLRAGAVIHHARRETLRDRDSLPSFHGILRNPISSPLGEVQRFCHSKRFHREGQPFSSLALTFAAPLFTMRTPFADRGSNAMNRWFATLHHTLDREGISGGSGKIPPGPGPVLCRVPGGVSGGLCPLVQVMPAWKRADSRFCGRVAKKCSEGPTAQIDKEFRALLGEAGIPFRWTDLSSELAIPPGELHASHACLEQIRGVVREGKEDAAIVLGSGSITDLVKHALHLEGRPIPFVSIPTALTVTAFTSAFAIIDFHGAKRTLQSRPVSAAFWVRPFPGMRPRKHVPGRVRGSSGPLRCLWGLVSRASPGGHGTI